MGEEGRAARGCGARRAAHVVRCGAARVVWRGVVWRCDPGGRGSTIWGCMLLGKERRDQVTEGRRGGRCAAEGIGGKPRRRGVPLCRRGVGLGERRGRDWRVPWVRDTGGKADKERETRRQGRGRGGDAGRGGFCMGSHLMKLLETHQSTGWTWF